MNRNFRNFNLYLNELMEDIYEQPPDPGHTEATQAIITKWASKLHGVKTVLDVGCGQGFAQPMFEAIGMTYTGVCLGDDFQAAEKSGYSVYEDDFSFLPGWQDDTFDLIFARHSLEHSPMPLLTLMEWHRVAKTYMILVTPTPRHWTWAGRNHYSVMVAYQLQALLERSGWKMIWVDLSDETEYRFMCQKVPRHQFDPKEDAE